MLPTHLDHKKNPLVAWEPTGPWKPCFREWVSQCTRCIFCTNFLYSWNATPSSISMWAPRTGCPSEEFNHLSQRPRDSASDPKTIELVISNDLLWLEVCNHLGWKFVPTV